MIDSLLNLLFRCPHRRLTRPVTPVSKPGVPLGETYVVCLDCGKQFAYDWDKMKMGKAIETSPIAGVLPPDLPKPRNAKVKYALLGSALPLLAVLLAKKKRGQPGVEHFPKPPEKPPS